jgi:hypothetical protein
MARVGVVSALGAAAAAVVVALVTAPAAGAQVPGVLGVELRAGPAVGSFEATHAGLEMNPGPALGLSVTWGPSERIGGYVSYASFGFGCEGAFCTGYDVSFVSRGLSLGARAQAPVASEPWLRAGVLFHSFEQRWGGASPGTVDSETSVGFEGAAGVTWRFGDRFSFVPGLYMGVLPTTAEDGAGERAFFTALELGARFTF